MTSENLSRVAEELKLSLPQVKATAALLIDGATVPFIARYRKEATGSLDEVAITSIRDRIEELDDLDKRRASIIKSLQERSLLTPQLETQIANSRTLTELEDTYLPFRPKRKTRASAAREKGLELLAQKVFAFECTDPLADAAAFVNAEKGVESAEDALAGARDIIAEWINEDTPTRGEMRAYWEKQSTIQSSVAKGKQQEGAKFRDYFDWEESVRSAPSHRVLAILRGESESFLRVTVAPPADEALRRLQQRFLKKQGPAAEQIKLAIEDCYKRLLAPSMETELRDVLKKEADAEAIHVFTSNLRELLLSPPLGRKRVMGVDPGVRTGCKIVLLDEQGALKHHDVVHLLGSSTKEAADKLTKLCEKYDVEAIAVGNGTGGREAESFLRQLLAEGKLSRQPMILMVNESGASIYSASQVARDEFPDHDVTVRGAVSIGRRLIDPLAELVKIDPKSIGVGQYQHDVDQSALKRSLDDVVVSCVNTVGVELNTASKQLLTYVSGLGPQLAAGIVKFRDENGAFKSREQLKKVPRLGAKAYEQAAGFLRIREADNPLDNSAVHPETYHIVDKIAKDMGHSVKDLIGDDKLKQTIDLKKYVSDKVGLPTLHDILQEIAKPGRDPRPPLNPVKFAEGITRPEDLKIGMSLEGVVTNVTAFGAFVDVGVHQDGLVHISQLADRFVKDPDEVVKVHQKVKVKVVSVDLDRKRIALTMRT
jgi:uncharacterized protein